MRILVAADDDTLADYLQRAGHKTKNLYVNDMAARVAYDFKADAIVYQTTVTPTISHEDAISTLKNAGFRVVLAAAPDIQLIPYAAALGVTDILTFPINTEDVLFRIENPATVAEVADVVRKMRLNAKREKDGVKAEEEISTGKTGIHTWFKRLIYGANSTGGSETFVTGEEAPKASETVVSNPVSHRPPKNKLGNWSLFSKKQDNTIVVISGEGGGKTTVAVNLAVTLSMQGYIIAFIDGDLESLAAHRLVGGVPAGRSLLYALENPSEAPGLLEPVPFAPQLYALTADPEHEIDVKLYSRLSRVIKKVSSDVDMVVVDTPPEIKKIRHLTKTAGRTVIIVSPGDNLEKWEVLKISKPILVLNRWPAGMEVSMGEELYGLRASCVIPELSEIQEAEHGGVPAVLGCKVLYRALNVVAEKLSCGGE